jgi:allophanate hydrolase
MTGLVVLRAGPGVTVQDLGRPGLLSQGVSRGGAIDTLALAEGAALLGQTASSAAIEIAGSFVQLTATHACRIALTGAPMRALCDGRALLWHASHAIPSGARIDLSGSAGGYSYLHVGGGIATDIILGARSAHLAAGIGRMLRAGDTLPTGHDRGGQTGLRIDPLPRFDGGALRMVESLQTALFPAQERERLTATVFTKDARANRMGQKLLPQGAGFGSVAGLSVLSDTVVPGDVQIAGDGAPFVLLAECQTTGGYPRIGTVIPCDLPRLAQTPVGAALRFCFVPLAEAVALEHADRAVRGRLRQRVTPALRNPRDMADLLSYQLIDGVTRGDELKEPGT